MSKALRKLNFKFKTFMRGMRPKKRLGYTKYSIVTACYNVEKYLDQYIKSLVNQSLSFRNNIQLILVDDGSTDATPSIAKKWESRFPGNIKYLRKENGGVSSARNFGLKYVKHHWVSFCGPDDFLDIFALERIDDFLERQKKDICMISMKVKFFMEEKFRFSDNHSLNYKYNKKEIIRKTSDLNDYIQLSAASAFIRIDVIQKNKLKFDENCRPNFEDAKLINQYLLNCINERVAFLCRAIYFYRKREDKSSTIDTSWSRPSQYSDVFEYGCLSLLNYAASTNNGIVPSFVQNVVIYHCSWYLDKLVNNDSVLYFLTKEQKYEFLEYLKKVYSYCGIGNILNVRRAPAGRFYIKVGELGFFKGTDLPIQKIFVEKIDYTTNEVRLRYFTCFLNKEEILVNGVAVTPSFSKTVQDTFVGQPFIFQRVLWVPLDEFNGDAIIAVRINGKPALLVVGKREDFVCSYQEIKEFYPQRLIDEDSKYAHCWLISDRDVQADDNGEHFYRWVRENKPNSKIYFLLNKNSHDWNRLKADGFALIPYGSESHREALQQCDAIISSHADDYITDCFNEKLPFWKRPKYVFLQHGVIQNDLSDWLNYVEINCFVTSCNNEYKSIACNNNRYNKLTSKEVKLTGLPRHDALLRNNNPDKVILVMPTWRSSIVGPRLGATNARKINPDFMNTKYASMWQELLTSNRFVMLAKAHGYKVKFFPHANIQPYINLFKVGDGIEKVTHVDARIQQLFSEGSLLITDYSSVAFDFAYLKKPVIYYQFDYDDVFRKHSHIVEKSYFDYKKDGFGCVVTDCTSLCDEIEKTLNAACKMSDIYSNRVDNFFAYRDGKCCERVYNEVIKLFDNKILS